MKAVILAGGNSSRMGTDKGLLTVGGRTLMDLILERLVVYFDEIIISGPKSKYGHFPNRIVEDEVKHCGPIGGIFSCLNAQQEDLFFCTCDMPFLSDRFFAMFLKHVASHQLTVAAYENQVFPTLGVYPYASSMELGDRMEKGNYRMQDFVNSYKGNIVHFDESFEHDFYNLNTPEEYALFLHIHKQQGK